jgi:hypothetical protein
VILQSPLAPSGLEMAVLPWIVAIPLTIGGVGHRAGFSFVCGSDREFDAQMVMIERPNLELAGWRGSGAIELCSRDTRVTGDALHCNNRGNRKKQRQGFPCFSHDAVTENRNTRESFTKARKPQREREGEGRLPQIFVGSHDYPIQSIKLVLEIESEMAFAENNDSFLGSLRVIRTIIEFFL